MIEVLGIISTAGARLQGYIDVEGWRKQFQRRDGFRYKIYINAYGPRDVAVHNGDALLERNIFL